MLSDAARVAQPRATRAVISYTRHTSVKNLDYLEPRRRLHVATCPSEVIMNHYVNFELRERAGIGRCNQQAHKDRP